MPLRCRSQEAAAGRQIACMQAAISDAVQQKAGAMAALKAEWEGTSAMVSAPPAHCWFRIVRCQRPRPA
jgi:hypothetical protein